MHYLIRLYFGYRYPALCLGVACLMAFQIRNGLWHGDFWEHAAVTRELATHFFRPVHPQLLLDAPHHFYSPFALAVAAFSMVAQLSPVSALSVVAFVNLALLLLALAAFSSVCAPANPAAARFYLLLFHLIFWGPGAWQYSGCFNLASLGEVLPYPSTFATAIALFGIWIFVRSQRTGGRYWYIAVWSLAFIIVLVHPVAFIFLAFGLLAFSLRGHRPTVLIAQVSVILLSTVVVAAFWPYYPFIDLIFRQSEIFHGSNRPMYQGILHGAGLALLALPLIALRLKADWRDPLCLMFLGLLAVYAYGGLSAQWSYGRVIPGMMLVAHMVLARAAADWEMKSRMSSFRLNVLLLLVFLFALSTCFLVYFNAFGLRSMLMKRWFPTQKETYAQYRFLSRFTGQYDVVLADMETSWPVPAFGGKIVAAWHPLTFVPDHYKRHEDVDAFFAADASNSERQRILRAYRVNYVLIRKKNPDWQKLVNSLKDFGTTVHEDDAFVLIAAKDNTSN